jgi:hypothetical protein
MLRGRTLVIAPLTLLPQWEVEAEKWFGATYAKWVMHGIIFKSLVVQIHHIH